MLRIESEQYDGHHMIVLHGSITGEWVSLLDRYWRSTADRMPSARIKVVLNDVSFIDREGERLLDRMWRQGVELEAHGCMNRYVIDKVREHSRLAAGRPNDGKA